jgi:hypothetical protein
MQVQQLAQLQQLVVVELVVIIKQLQQLQQLIVVELVVEQQQQQLVVVVELVIQQLQQLQQQLIIVVIEQPQLVVVQLIKLVIIKQLEQLIVSPPPCRVTVQLCMRACVGVWSSSAELALHDQQGICTRMCTGEGLRACLLLACSLC